MEGCSCRVESLYIEGNYEPFCPAKIFGAAQNVSDTSFPFVPLQIQSELVHLFMFRFKSIRLASRLAFFVLALAVIGCDLPPRPPITRAEVEKEPEPIDREEVEIVEPPQEAFPGSWESWEVYRIGQRGVGYRHIVAEEQLDSILLSNGSSTVKYVVDDEILFRRGHLRFLQSLRQSSIETSHGEMKSLDVDLRVGPIQTKFIGTITDKNLPIEVVRGTVRSTRTIPWDPTSRGLLARYQSLRRTPMKKGETRKLRYLLPWRYEMAMAELICSGETVVPLLDGKFEKLIEITCRTRVGDQIVAEQMIWTNAKGEVQKTLEPQTRLESFLTDQRTAMEALDDPLDIAQADADLAPAERRYAAAVDVEGWIDRSTQASRVAFVVALEPRPGESQSETTILSMEAAPNQMVRAMEGGFQVLVTRQKEDRAGFADFTEMPTEDDLAETTVFDFGQPIVSRMAAGMAGSEPTRAALETTKVVHNVMSLANDAVIERASVIAKRGSGGNLQHALLLTALLRSQSIPARLAIGLKYESLSVPPDASDEIKSKRSRMDLHYWTLAYIDDEWIALDATTGTTASADRITLMTSHLKGANEYTDIGRAFEMLGRLKIKVLRAQYDEN